MSMKQTSKAFDLFISDQRWKKVGKMSEGCDWGAVGGAGLVGSMALSAAATIYAFDMAEVLKKGNNSSRIARRSLGSKYELAWRQSFKRCFDDLLREP